YAALSTSDVKFPSITLSDGSDVTVSYAQYRAIIATRRNQEDRRRAFEALYGTYDATLNTYATLYHGVCQRDWFQARARGYTSTLEAALHGDNIPTSVVETLISATRDGVAPLRRYHQLRRRHLGLAEYYPFDFSIPLSRSEEHTSELQSRENLVCRLLLEKKKKIRPTSPAPHMATTYRAQ